MYSFRTLRITTQVLFLMLFVYSLILLSGVGLLMANVAIASHFIADSQNIMMSKQIDNQLRSLSYLASLQVQSYVQRIENRLYVVNKLFNLSHTQAIELDDPLQCLNYHIDAYAGLSSYCFGIFGDIKNSNITSDREFKKLQSLLTYSFPILDNTFDVLTNSLTKNEIFSIWPGQIMPGYIPSSRPWYKKHMEEISQANAKMYDTYYSTPYIHYNLHTPTTSQTMSIYNLDNSVYGIASCQLNLTLVLPSEFFKKINAQAFIIDNDGIMLFGEQEKGTLTQLKDTQIFSNVDQDKIIQQAHGVEQQHNCTYLNNTELLCLRNKTSDEELIVQTSLFKSGNLMLAIAINPSIEIQYVKDSDEFFNQQIDEISIQIIENACYLLLGSLIIAGLMLAIIQNSINQIIKQTKVNIYKDRRIRAFTMDKLQQLHECSNQKVKKKKFNLLNTTILKLNKAYQRLSMHVAKNISSKNPICEYNSKLKSNDKQKISNILLFVTNKIVRILKAKSIDQRIIPLFLLYEDIEDTLFENVFLIVNQ